MDFVEVIKHRRTRLMVELFNKYHVSEDKKQKAEMAFNIAVKWSSEDWEIEDYFADMLLLIED